jgi:Domain of unknown function (DUF1937)
MIYLASPYSHPNPMVRETRFEAACRTTARLIQAGQTVFSPIVHGHPLVHYGLPTDWSFWQRFGKEHLQRCDDVLVLQIDGWQESEGVQAEVELARGLGKRIQYLSPENKAISLSFRSWPHVAPVGHEAYPGGGWPHCADPRPEANVARPARRRCRTFRSS